MWQVAIVYPVSAEVTNALNKFVYCTFTHLGVSCRAQSVADLRDVSDRDALCAHGAGHLGKAGILEVDAHVTVPEPEDLRDFQCRREVTCSYSINLI